MAVHKAIAIPDVRSSERTSSRVPGWEPGTDLGNLRQNLPVWYKNQQ